MGMGVFSIGGMGLIKNLDVNQAYAPLWTSSSNYHKRTSRFEPIVSNCRVLLELAWFSNTKLGFEKI